MAKLKAIGINEFNLSQQGEFTNVRQQEEAAVAMNEAPVANEGVTYKIFKLSDTKKNGKYHMEGIDDVWNPDKKRMERIRLLTGYPSIWVEDQKGLEKSFVEKNRRSLIFDRRVLRIPDYDTAALEFLSICNANLDNPNKKGTRKITFFQWNPQRTAELEREKRVAKVAAIKYASLASDEEMRKHCHYLGILFTDELNMPKSNEALRNDYELYAEAQPNKFMQSAGSKEVEIAYVVKKAILDNKIDVNSKQGSAYWAGDGGFICKIPAASQPKDYLIEYAMMPNDESRQFLSQLKKLQIN
jgi:hypothetical protein